MFHAPSLNVYYYSAVVQYKTYNYKCTGSNTQGQIHKVICTKNNSGKVIINPYRITNKESTGLYNNKEKLNINGEKY